MWELVKAGGWLMLPIIVCSIVASVIIIERGKVLRMGLLAPSGLREKLVSQLRTKGDIAKNTLLVIKGESPLGDILATGLEKNINMLGTIGAIAPLLGLLGTVLGIIISFLAVTDGSMQDPAMLAGGVSQALITTAGGMFVAIPALMAYRYFQRRIVDINARFESEAGLLIQEMYDYGLIKDNLQHGLSQVYASEPVAYTQSQCTQSQEPS